LLPVSPALLFGLQPHFASQKTGAAVLVFGFYFQFIVLLGFVLLRHRRHGAWTWRCFSLQINKNNIIQVESVSYAHIVCLVLPPPDLLSSLSLRSLWSNTSTEYIPSFFVLVRLVATGSWSQKLGAEDFSLHLRGISQRQREEDSCEY
jgi:hypothetical protein